MLDCGLEGALTVSTFVLGALGDKKLVGCSLFPLCERGLLVCEMTGVAEYVLKLE
jgi:hypothetical protein